MNLANQLTLFRILLVPGLIIAIVYDGDAHSLYRNIALILFSLGCLTDAIDGYVARTFNQRTELGTLLDPLADKLLLLSAFLSINAQPHFLLKPPIWVIIIVTSRDAMIIMGLLILFFTTGKIEVSPNFLGKSTTFFQMVTVISLLLQHPVSPFLWYLTAFLTVLSGLVYLVREGRRLREISVP